MTCLDDDVLFALAERRLDPAELDRVNAHLDDCPKCLRIAADLMRAEEVPAPSPRRASSIGTVRSGTRIDRYVVIEQLGAGAMGEVFSAKDPDLNRLVALKLLRSDREATEDAAERRRQRMRREAQALARVSHPNLLSVHDVVINGDQLVIAMELVAGASARQWLTREHRSWREILDVYLKAGRGLAAAHDAGLVHRDFKPDNVLVGDDGLVKVSDFGLATSSPEAPPTSEGSELADITDTGVVLGTPAYMAPDQLAGAAATPASDQFSFCVSLFDALYGARPFGAASVEALISEIRTGRPRRPPAPTKVPRRIYKVLARGLGADASKRYASMHELLGELERAAKPRWNRLLLVVSALVLLPTLVRSIAPGGCEPVGRRLVHVYGPTRRAEIREAIFSTQSSEAAETFAFMDAGLGAFLHEWSAAYEGACKATWDDQAQSERVFFLKMACLEERLETVQTSLAQIRSGDSASVGIARALAGALPELDPCRSIGDGR